MLMTTDSIVVELLEESPMRDGEVEDYKVHLLSQQAHVPASTTESHSYVGL